MQQDKVLLGILHLLSIWLLLEVAVVDQEKVVAVLEVFFLVQDFQSFRDSIIQLLLVEVVLA
jgi:hypothetical protein